MAGGKENESWGLRSEIRFIPFLIYSPLLFHTIIYRPGHVQVVVIDKEPLFFSLRDGQYFPTLRVLHQC